MDNIKLTFRDLIELVNISVKSKTIEKDYPSLLKGCRGLGISSYVLNIIIQRSNQSQENDSKIQEDNTFFISIATESKSKDKDDKKETQTITKIERKTSKVAWFFIVFLVAICMGDVIYIFNLIENNKKIKNELNELNIRNEEEQYKLRRISVLTSDLSEDASFSNWTSSNHEHSTESHNVYKFQASVGDKLSYNFFVSSESGFDYLTVTLEEATDTLQKELTKVSGNMNSSKSYTFNRTGNYSLYVKYAKDGSVHHGNDNAGVSNISLHRNYKSILDSIKNVINK